MDTNIVIGVSDFLNSHSYMLLLLNKIEMSVLNEVDYNNRQVTFYNAIRNTVREKMALEFPLIAIVLKSFNTRVGFALGVKLLVTMRFHNTSEFSKSPTVFCVTEDELFIISDYNAGNMISDN